MLLLCALVGGVSGAWGDSAGFTLTGSAGSTATGSIAGTQSETWSYNATFTNNATGSAQNSSWQVGASKNPCTQLILSTSGISGTITQIDVSCGAQSGKGTVNCTVGGAAFGTQGQSAGAGNNPSNYGTTPSFSGSASGTIVVTINNTGTYISLKSITVTYSTATPHTLSSAVSPVGVGMVTLGATSVAEGNSTSISATVTNEAYRFKNWTATSGTIANENTASTIFTMGTADATVTANFEEIPSHTLSYAISPVGAGTVTLGASSVREGATTTATAAANAGYKFTGWSITGTGASLSDTEDNPVTITMGTANATVTANFDAVTTYAINWSVNGSVVKTDNVEENTAITFPTSISGIPTGYVLKGWVTAANRIDGTTDTDPAANYVTSATSTAVTTYYAVMAVEGGTPIAFSEYQKVTTSQSDWSGTYLLGATYSGGNDESKKGTFVFTGPNDGGTLGDYAKITPGTTEYTDYEIVINKVGDNYTIYHTNSGKYFSYSSGNAMAFSDDADNNAEKWTITGTTGVITNVGTSGRILQYNGASPRFACYTSTQVATNLYKRIETGGPTYSNYCTTIPDEAITVSSIGLATYASDFDLDFTNVSGLEAYIAKEESSAIKLHQVEKVPAGTGVLLRATNDGTNFNVPLFTSTADDMTGNIFVRGTGAAVATQVSTTYNYILNNVGGVVGFYRANGQTVATNRAYLATSLANARVALNFDEDKTTSISEMGIKNNEIKATTIYDLQGRKVENPTRGLYIINGKKVVIK